MVWDLAWWGNSSDGNKVCVIRRPLWGPLGRGIEYRTTIYTNATAGSAVRQQQYPIVPKLEVDSSQGQHEDCCYMRLQCL